MATLKDRILALKEAHPTMKASSISKRLGVKPSYVYTTVYLANKAKRTKVDTRKAPAAPTRIVDPTKTFPGDVMAAEIDDLRKEIGELTTIIAYLERRCASWERRYGSPV